MAFAMRQERGRGAAARAGAAAGALTLGIARAIRLLVAIVVALIVLAIVLRLLAANPSNSVVKDIHDAGRTVVGPFRNVFSIKRPKVSIAVNWGLAAVVYALVGTFLARLVTRIGPR
jgi:hypothetical protein